jgi:hypothetical protein
MARKMPGAQACGRNAPPAAPWIRKSPHRRTQRWRESHSNRAFGIRPGAQACAAPSETELGYISGATLQRSALALGNTEHIQCVWSAYRMWGEKQRADAVVENDVLIEYYDDPAEINRAFESQTAVGKQSSGARDARRAAVPEPYSDESAAPPSESRLKSFSSCARSSLERVRNVLHYSDTTTIGAGIGVLVWFGWRQAVRSARKRAQQRAPDVQHGLERRLFLAILGHGLGMRYLNEKMNPALSGSIARLAPKLYEETSPLGSDSLITPDGTPLKTGSDFPHDKTQYRALLATRQTEHVMRNAFDQVSASRPLRRDRADNESEVSPATPMEKPRPFLRAPRVQARPNGRAPCAFVTVCSSGTYVLPAVVLASTLQQYHAGIPMICLVVSTAVDKWHREVLSRAGWDVRSCSSFLSDLEWQGFLSSRDLSNRELKRPFSRRAVRHGTASHAASRFTDAHDQWERSTFDKLNIWELVDFEKLIYLDADTIVLGALHELFRYEELAAVKSGCGLFNSGVMVIHPGLHTYQALRNCLLYEEWRSAYTRGYPFPYGDQPLLNYFFKDTFTELPVAFNTTCQRRFRSRQTRVLHFNGPMKPWHVDRSSWFAAQCFWKQQRWRLWYQEYDHALSSFRANADPPEEQCFWA